MKKGIIRKTVSLMIFALLFSGVCSTTVLAATVANIGSKNYSSLDKALKEARNGQTITLKKNAVYHTNWLGYFGGSIVILEVLNIRNGYFSTSAYTARLTA